MHASTPSEPSILVKALQALGDEKPAYDIGAKRRKFLAYESNKDREIKESQEARRYYHGKQWTDDEEAALRRRGQPLVTDNRIARKIDFLVGVEQRMRRDPKGYPRTPMHEADADASTASIRYVGDTNRWEQIASNVAHDGIVANLGVAWVGIEAGEVRVKWVDPTRFFYDPRSLRPDFSDARFVGVHLWMDIEEAIEQWPQHEAVLRSMIDQNTGNLAFTRSDGDRAQQWADFEKSRVRIVEFWEKRAGQWEHCFFSGEVELESGPSPYQDAHGQSCHPYEAWSAYIDERGDRYGVVRNMRSMQDEINHRRSKLLHLVNVRQVFVQTGAVNDVDELKQQLARPDGVIEHNGEWGKTVGVVEHADMVRGQADLLIESQSSLENLGPNPGLIGKGGGIADQSGRAILAQRDAGMTELSPVFERLRDWKLRCYRAMWARIRQSWTSERWVRVTDDERSVRFVGFNQYGQDPETGAMTAQNVVAELDVDIILDEGPDTVIMKEELLQTMSQLGEAAAGPMGRIMVELSNVPNKEHLLKMIEEASQPGPNPELEIKAQENQYRMAEMQQKGQIDMALAEANVQIKQLDIELKQLELQAKQYEVAAEQSRTEASLHIEDRKARLEETKHVRTIEQLDRKHALEMAKMERDAQVAEASHERVIEQEDRKFEMDTAQRAPPRKRERAVNAIVDRLARAMAAPKEILRGPDGRAIGVQARIDLSEADPNDPISQLLAQMAQPRMLRRDASNRAVGIE